MTDLENIPDYTPPMKAIGPTRRLAHVIISQAADNKVTDLELAFSRFVLAKEEDREDAWTHVHECRKALYEHVARLEGLTGGPYVVRKRF